MDRDEDVDPRAAPFAVVLCAGGSSRMGQPKALLPLGGGTVLDAHLDRLRGVCSEIVVVLGARASTLEPRIPDDVRVVVNPEWATTHPSDSLRIALRALRSEARSRGVHRGFVVPVDTPPARRETLERLLRAGAPSVPLDAAGRPGHPVLIGSDTIDRVVGGPVPGGLVTLLGQAKRVPTGDPFVAVDFDSPAEWGRFVRDWSG